MDVKGSEPIDEVRLHRLLGGADLAWLVERVRRRMERGQPLAGSVSLAAPAPAQRAAVERLLGRSPGGGATLTLRLVAVDAVLRRSGISPLWEVPMHLTMARRSPPSSSPASEL